MSSIEIQKIIKPINASDGAGVKLKRSIGVEPNYFDPFLMLDEFGSENSEDYIAGFPPHPHRGIETVTYMLAGDFEHKDSTGGEGKMSAGDVQWMKTGSGIIHSEMPAMKEGKLHGFQLWINMPAKLKMSKPEYIYIDADKMKIHKDKDKQIKVIAGKFEKAEGPVKGHNVEPIYFDVELNKGKKFDFKIPSTHNSFIYLINGEIEIGEKKHTKVKDSTLVLLSRGENLKVSAKINAKFLVISGKPINEESGPEVLTFKDTEIGKPGPKEVLIKNLSIGLNYIDVYHRTGLYPIPLPSGIGLESCGVIEEVGSDIKFFKIGDRVTHASMPIGAYSEKQIMPEEKLVSVPDGVSDEVASCITLKGITAEYLLHRAYPLKKGDKVLYHAAAGGLGQILCPWANALGAEVIGTVGSKAKEEIAKKNGCHHVINYSEKNFVEEVEKIVGKNGIDVVYDGVGIKTFKGSIETLKIRGMMVAFGNASGYVDTIDVKKDINAKGLFFTRPSIAHYTIKREELVESAKKVFDAVLSKKFNVEISKKYSLQDAAQAHKDLEARILTGPAVIIP